MGRHKVADPVGHNSVSLTQEAFKNLDALNYVLGGTKGRLVSDLINELAGKHKTAIKQYYKDLAAEALRNAE